MARPVSPAFVRAVARVINACATPATLLLGVGAVTLMASSAGPGRLRLAVKRKIHVYVEPDIDMGTPVLDIEVVSPFPVVTIRPDGTRFRVKVPPNGGVVMDVCL